MSRKRENRMRSMRCSTWGATWTSAGDIGEFTRRARSVWFCGPKTWGKKLRSALRREHGLRPEQFHRELFEFL